MQIYTLIIPSNKLVLINKEKNCYSIDYKSIALPAELQGHKLFCIMNLRFIKLIFFVGLYNEKQ